MSFFSWFLDQSRQSRGAATAKTARIPIASDKLPTALQHRLAPHPSNQEDAFKSKSHSRREQLYEAIREAMTKAGVLSASYKFKVLSFDQLSKDFLVLIVKWTPDSRQQFKQDTVARNG